MKYIVGNWKSNKKSEGVADWFGDFGQVYRKRAGVEVVVAPSWVHLSMADQARKELSGVKLASQDVSPFPFGAYTGAVAAEMIKGMVEYAIVGHSERRRYFHETDQEVANKVKQVKEVGIVPLVCVDVDYAKSQLAAIEDSAGLIVAYEPLEAIGTGNPQDPGEVEKVVAEIKQMEEGLSVLYGGSVNENNVGEYLEVEGVDGLLVGGASLKADSFSAIVEAA